MNKKTITTVLIAIFVTSAVWVVGLEIGKSNARTEAIARFNTFVATKKDEKTKIAAISEINAMLSQNKSWFDFSSSGAMVQNPNDESSGWWETFFGGDSSSDRSSVTTYSRIEGDGQN